MNLSELIARQNDFDKAHESRKPFFVSIGENNLEDLEHLVVCLVGEVGEFANILKKVVRGDLSFEAARPSLSEELADVFIYLVKIASQTDIDLEASFLKKLDINKMRFSDWAKP